MCLKTTTTQRHLQLDTKRNTIVTPDDSFLASYARNIDGKSYIRFYVLLGKKRQKLEVFRKKYLKKIVKSKKIFRGHSGECLPLFKKIIIINLIAQFNFKTKL